MAAAGATAMRAALLAHGLVFSFCSVFNLGFCLVVPSYWTATSKVSTHL